MEPFEVVTEEQLTEVLRDLAPRFAQLDDLVRASGEPLEGNILYMHQSFDANPKNVPKQRNLYSLAKALPVEDAVIAEIGFNAGHSSLLMLAANPTVKLVAFDLCEHGYTRPCFEALSAIFPGRLQLIPGKSQQTIPAFVRSNILRADLLHIDGDHQEDRARTDVEHGALLGRPGAIVVFDDLCFSPLAAVWREMHERAIIEAFDMPICPTNRHGIAKYARASAKPNESLLWEVMPTLGHRGLSRHVLVLAPVDHGQDSLLGYLSKQRSWQGRAPRTQKLAPHRTDRHQHQWFSQPLRWQPEGQLPVLVHLVAPPFHESQEIAECFPLVDGFLAVVDCAEGLTQDFTNHFQAACLRGLHPVLFLNKLDKLLALEQDNELCYQRLAHIVDTLNAQLQGTTAKPLDVNNGNVVFGRGSLSVAASIGGWGFTVHGFLKILADRKNWTQDQLSKFQARVWGDHTLGNERCFCALVVRPMRELFLALETSEAAGAAKLALLGVNPPLGLTGNAWKQGAVEAWLPLADTLLREVARHVPPPKAVQNGMFYAAKSVLSADGKTAFAFGRKVAPPFPIVPRCRSEGVTHFLNGPIAVEVPSVSADCGALLGLALGSLHTGAILIET